jgi:hypothetical protein
MIGGLAVFLVEDQTLRLLMLVIAGMDVIITPQILKRAVQTG